MVVLAALSPKSSQPNYDSSVSSSCSSQQLQPLRLASVSGLEFLNRQNPEILDNNEKRSSQHLTKEDPKGPDFNLIINPPKNLSPQMPFAQHQEAATSGHYFPTVAVENPPVISYLSKYAEVESYGLELESPEDVSSDENESSTSPSPEPYYSSSGEDSSSSTYGRIILDTDEDDDDYEYDDDRGFDDDFSMRGQEVYELSANKLRSMSCERGSEMCLRKSVLIFNTMRALRRSLDFSDFSSSSDEFLPENSTASVGEAPVLEVNFQEDEIPPAVSPWPMAEEFLAGSDEKLEAEENDEGNSRRVDGMEWPSEHVYSTEPDTSLMLCQQRLTSGGWTWSVAQSEPTDTRDTGYIQLDSARIDSQEGMDTSEGISSGSRQVSEVDSSFQREPGDQQQSVFASTWSECTRSWEILNMSNLHLASHLRELNQNFYSTHLQQQQQMITQMQEANGGDIQPEFFSLFTHQIPTGLSRGVQLDQEANHDGEEREETLNVPEN